MQRARRHQRFSAGLAFALLALVAELAGRSLTHRLDFGRHVASPSYSGAEYYPFLLAAVKLGLALVVARVVWRFARAHIAARTARRVLSAVGSTPAPAPRVPPALPPRPSRPARALAATLAVVVPGDVDLLSRPAGRGAARLRAVAPGRTLAAHVGVAGLRDPRGLRGRRLGRRQTLAARVRALRRGDLGAGGPPRARRHAASAHRPHRDRSRSSSQALRPGLRVPAAAS